MTNKLDNLSTEAWLTFEFAKTLIAARGNNTPGEEDVFRFSQNLAARFIENYPMLH